MGNNSKFTFTLYREITLILSTISPYDNDNQEFFDNNPAVLIFLTIYHMFKFKKYSTLQKNLLWHNISFHWPATNYFQVTCFFQPAVNLSITVYLCYKIKLLSSHVTENLKHCSVRSVENVLEFSGTTSKGLIKM